MQRHNVVIPREDGGVEVHRLKEWLRQHPALTAADIAGIDRDFRKRAQAVQAVDQMIGELQAAVAAIGEERNTYFVFSSDNGYHMGEHRLMPGKMTAFDTDIHVPLVVTGPGIAPGRVVEEIADNIDLNPTFTEIGGAATAANVDGRSLLPLLHGRPVTEWRKAALIEHHGNLKDASDPDFPGKHSGASLSSLCYFAASWAPTSSPAICEMAGVFSLPDRLAS